MSAARLGLACIQRGTPALRRRLQHISQVSRSSRNSALSFQSRSWSFLRLHRSSESSVSITSAISINQYILIDNSLVPSLLSVLSVVSEHRDVASPARYISSFVVHHDPVVSVRRVLPLHRPPAKRAPLQIAHRSDLLHGSFIGRRVSTQSSKSRHRRPARNQSTPSQAVQSAWQVQLASSSSRLSNRSTHTSYQTFVLHSTTNVCDDLR